MTYFTKNLLKKIFHGIASQNKLSSQFFKKLWKKHEKWHFLKTTKNKGNGKNFPPMITWSLKNMCNNSITGKNFQKYFWTLSKFCKLKKFIRRPKIFITSFWGHFANIATSPFTDFQKKNKIRPRFPSLFLASFSSTSGAPKKWG